MFQKVVLSLAILFAALAEHKVYKVVSVTDGETIKVLIDNKLVTIRLEGIDAPESKQDFGTEAKHTLSKLLFGKSVVVEKTGVDKYGRTLAKIFVNGVNVNDKMVEDGFAWHYKQFNQDENLARFENLARLNKKGLWSHPNPIPPWEFRTKSKTDFYTGDKFWLNTSNGVRHNERCNYYGRTINGRECERNEGRPCGICGG